MYKKGHIFLLFTCLFFSSLQVQSQAIHEYFNVVEGQQKPVSSFALPNSDGHFVAFSVREYSQALSGYQSTLFIRDRRESSYRALALPANISEKLVGLNLSPDNANLFFLSQDSNLISGDNNNQSDIFKYHLATDTLNAVLGVDGEVFDYGVDDFWPVKRGGIYFSSRSTNVIADTVSSPIALYYFDTETESIELVFENFNQVSIRDISDDGEFLLLTGESIDPLIEPDNLYHYRKSTKTLTQVAQPPYQSYAAKYRLSGDGNTVLVYLSNQQHKALYRKSMDAENYHSISLPVSIENVFDVNFDGSAIIYKPYVSYGSDMSYGYRNLLHYLNLGSGESLALNGVGSDYSKNNRFAAFFSDTVLFQGPGNAYSSSSKLQSTSLDAIRQTSVSSSVLPVTATTGIGKIELAYEDISEQSVAIYTKKQAGEDAQTIVSVNDTREYTFEPDSSVPYQITIKQCNRYLICDVGQSVVSQATTPSSDIIDLVYRDPNELQWQPVEGATHYKLQFINELGQISHEQSTTNSYRSYYFDSSVQYLYIKIQACAENLCSIMSDWFEIDKHATTTNSVDLEYDFNRDVIDVTWQSIESAAYYHVVHSEQLLVSTATPHFVWQDFAKNTETQYVSVRAFNTSGEKIADYRGSIQISSFGELDGKLSVSQKSQTEAEIRVRSLRYGTEAKLYKRSQPFAQKQLVQTFIGNDEDYVYHDPLTPDVDKIYYSLEVCNADECQESETIFNVKTHYFNVDFNFDVQMINAASQALLTWDLSQYNVTSITVKADDRTVATLDNVQNSFTLPVVPGKEVDFQLVANFGNDSVPSPIIQRVLRLNDSNSQAPTATPNLQAKNDFYFDRVELSATKSDANPASYLKVFTENELGNYIFLRDISQSAYSPKSVYTFSLQWLAAGSQVKVKAQWCNFIGCGPLSDAITASTSDATSTPSSTEIIGLVVRQTDSHAVADITWTAAANTAFYNLGRSSYPFGYVYQVGRFQNAYAEVTQDYSTTQYYYVQACSAHGCSPWSSAFAFNSGMWPENSTRNLASFTSLNYSADSNSILININRPTASFDYQVLVSLTKAGPKQAVTPDGSRFILTDVQRGQRYYFWIENCSSQQVCTFSDLHREFYLASPPQTLPKPEVIASTDQIGKITVKPTRKIDWLEYHYSYRLPDSDSVQEKVLKSYQSIALTLDKSYRDSIVDFTVKQCVVGTETCSQSISVTGIALAQYTDQIVDVFNGPQRGIYGRYNRYAEKSEAFTFSNLSLKQKFYTGKGVDIAFNIFIPLSAISSEGCNDVFSLASDVDDLTRSSAPPVVELTYLGDKSVNRHNCDAGLLSDYTSHSFNLNIQDETIIPLDNLSTQSWHRVRINHDETGLMKVFIDEQLVYQGVVQADLDSFFKWLKFTSDSGRKVVFNDFSIIAKSPLAASHIAPTRYGESLYTRGFGKVDIFVQFKRTDFDYLQLQLFSKSKQKVVFEKNYIKSELTAEYDGFSTVLRNDHIGEFYVLVNYCRINGLCTEVNVAREWIYHSLSSTSITNTETLNELKAIAVEWSEIVPATFYQVYIASSKSGNGVLAASTSQLRTELRNITQTVYVYVKACDEYVCSSASSRVSVTPNLDSDGDGLTDQEELALGTNPYNPDSDFDGIPDKIELDNELDPLNANDAFLDSDNDGLTNVEEYQLGTEMRNRDTDGDGIIDGLDEEPLVKANNNFIDLDSNGKPDFLLLGQLSNSKQAVLFYDSASGTQTGAVSLPVWFSGSQVEVISDANSNSVNDIVVLGETTDGKKAWMTFDSQTRKTLNAVVYPGWFQPTQLAVVPDYSGNTKDEILVLGQTSDGKRIWMLHDSGTKVEYSRHIYPSWYTPSRIVITNDMNGNNKPELLSQGVASDGRSTWMVHDVHTKALLSSQKQASWLTIIEGRNLADISGNSLEDYAWLGRTSNGKSVMRVQDAQSGEVVNTLQYYSWYTPLKMALQADSDSSGFAEVVSLGQTSDGKHAWLSHDSYHHNQLAARVFPAWYQPTSIKTIPDINNDGVDDILVRGNTSDGKVVLMVQNGQSGQDIKVIVLPSWFTPY